MSARGGVSPTSDSEALVAIADVLGIRREGSPPCTSLAARWCPNHGECTCPDPENDLEDAACPLHALLGEHAEETTPFEFDWTEHDSAHAEDMAKRLNKIAEIVRARLTRGGSSGEGAGI